MDVNNYLIFAALKQMSKNIIHIKMKKIFLIALSVIFTSVAMTSCRSHERCAAYGKINKIDSGKSIKDKTQRAI